MGFVIFIIIVAAIAGAIGELTDFISDYRYWIGMAIAALTGYKFVRQWFENAEAEHEKALAEDDQRRMAQMASGPKVNLSKTKPLGDDEEEEEEDSGYSNIGHMTK